MNTIQFLKNFFSRKKSQFVESKEDKEEKYYIPSEQPYQFKDIPVKNKSLASSQLTGKKKTKLTAKAKKKAYERLKNGEKAQKIARSLNLHVSRIYQIKREFDSKEN